MFSSVFINCITDGRQAVEPSVEQRDHNEADVGPSEQEAEDFDPTEGFALG
jgi:hypothetical protein